MIKVESVAHTYRKEKPIVFPDWYIEDMEQWLLLGASGSGKSTLLNHIAGLLKPVKGNITINGTNLYQLTTKEIDKFRGMYVGIVFQRPHFIQSLTILENLALASSMCGLKQEKERNLSLLDDLGVAEKKDKYPRELSQGQLQRVSVARALVNRPDLLIADEPTSSLDDKNALQVLEMLTSQAKNNGAALIIATHDQRVRMRIPKTYLL
jgi:putative ABC transport system ATP-binding protein